MRTRFILGLICCFLGGFFSEVSAQQTVYPTNPEQVEKPEKIPVLHALSTEEQKALYYTPMGERVAWTEAQQTTFSTECERGTIEVEGNLNLDCNCLMKSISEEINFKKYSYNNAYNKGRIYLLYGRENCVE